MNIRLNWMIIKNFKGIQDFRLDANGNNISILGDNATYKTTTYDAFCWLISGKDSFNRSDFGVKPLDEHGNEIHFLETEVEAELFVDDVPLKLQKTQTENWVKPRGQTEQEYKGNNTAYFFDDVPVGASVFKENIDKLIGEETFRLLINPLYFNQHYKMGKLTDWQSRRMLLFEMCGEITDDDIIKANPKLDSVPQILSGKSIDDRKAIIAQSIRKLNEQITVIGPKINENMRLIPDTNTDYTATEQELKKLKIQLDDIEQELATAGNSGNEYRKKQQELFSMKSRLEDVKSRIYREANAGYQKATEEKNSLLRQKSQKQLDGIEAEKQIKNFENSIQENISVRQQLLDEWKQLKASLAKVQTLECSELDEDSLICPTCGQDLPESMKGEKIEEFKTKFESDKKMKAANIECSIRNNIAAGKTTAQEIQEAEVERENVKYTIADIDEKIMDINVKIANLNSILQAPVTEPNYIADSEYSDLARKIDQLQAELEKPVEDITAEIRAKKAEITEDIDACNRILNNNRIVDEAKARIEELKQSEKDLSNQKSQLERQQDLLTEFIKAKANTLTDIMNSKFKHVKFELFTNQITNNALIECCNTLVNTNGCWVPFTDGNTAGKINAGIDITNALSEHYGVRVPLWVDNRESLTDLVETESQVISLIKPDIKTAADRKKYSRLNIEMEDKSNGK